MQLVKSLTNSNKIKLSNHNISDECFCFSSKVDKDLKYQDVYYVVANDSLYIFNQEFELIRKIHKDDFEDFKFEHSINYVLLYIVKDNQYDLIGCFEKDNKDISNLSKDIFDNPKAIKKDNNVCPYCNSIINPKKGYCNKCYGKVNIIKRLLKYAKNYKIIYISMIALFLLSSATSLLITVFSSKTLYNQILTPTGKYYGKIMLFASVYFALEVILHLLQILYRTTIIKASNKLAYEMKNDVFSSLSNLSLSFFTNKQTGTLMNRIIYDVNQIYNFIISAIPNFIINVTKLMTLLVYLLIINYSLTLIAIAPSVIIVIIFIYFFPIMNKKWEQNNLRNNNLTSIITNTFEGFRTVKAFSKEDKEIKRFAKSSLATRNTFIQNERFRNIFYTIVLLLISSSGILLWYFGGLKVIENELDYGDFYLFVATLEMLYGPLEYLTSIIFQDLARVISSGRRIFEIKDAKAQIIEKENPITLNNIKGNVRFENVSFSYDGINLILDNISFEIKENSTLGIVGKTGVGKTTLVNLLSRLYDPTKGKILIDGIDIKDVSLKSLHQNVALISQDIYLFNDSIYQNVKYAKEEASYQDVIEACKKAGAHDFIINLKNGYDTILGKENINLSTGQKQKLAIARAILLDSKIIIFDEATSAMDSINERKIQEAINNLSKGKTLIIIAHRLSTLKDANILIVLDNNKIVERGTLKQLIELNGLFKQLYDIQQEALKHLRIGDEYDGLSRLSTIKTD